MTCRVAVVGGGAAGLMAAIAAARHRQAIFATQDDAAGSGDVIILEKLERVGKKILITGNGRCNLSNLHLNLDAYHGGDRQFIATVLAQQNAEQTLDFWRELGLICRSDERGRLYPYSLQASAVLDILRLSASRYGVTTQTGFAVTDISPVPGSGYLLTAADGRAITACQVIIATGGLAAPKLGCDGSGYRLLGRFGHRTTAIFPSLVQIRTETDFVRGLAGIKFEGSAQAVVDQVSQHSSSGEILFTEYGLSGPPMLDLSRTVAQALHHDAQATVEIVLDLLPDLSRKALADWLIYRRHTDPDITLNDFLTGLINKKLGQAMIKHSLDDSLSLAQPAAVLDRRQLAGLAYQLKHLTIRAVGTRDWSQAQVTAGGVETDAFSPLTLESRLTPGLYAAGEILDVDGDCGGFNLHWAWSTGQIAGVSAMQAALDGR